MTKGLVRRYGCGNLHFITCSCYRFYMKSGRLLLSMDIVE